MCERYIYYTCSKPCILRWRNKIVDPRGFIYCEEFEGTKGVIRICKSKNRQYNGKKRPKWQTKGIQCITQKIKDRVTRTPIKTVRELMCCFTNLMGIFSFLYRCQSTQLATVFRTYFTAGKNGIRRTTLFRFTCSKSWCKSTSSTSLSWWIFWWRRFWISKLIEERNCINRSNIDQANTIL